MSERANQNRVGPDEGLLDTNEAARLLGISPRTVQSWVRRGQLPHIKLSEGKTGLTRFRPAALREWIAAREVNAPEGEQDR